MLLFVDESGQDRRAMPYEVLAGVAIAESDLWNLIRAVYSAEKEHFGDYLRNLVTTERKAKVLLKRKRFRSARRGVVIDEKDIVQLAYSALQKGKEARLAGRSESGVTERELVAYSRSVLRFVHTVLDLAAQYGVQVFASVVDREAPRPDVNHIRMDYQRLFERYFYYLETLPRREERGLVVFDELEHSQAHLLIGQMASYFLGTSTGRYRSSRIVPEPFFVHSDLTTGIFLADLVAYIIGWSWRLNHMDGVLRNELRPYADKVHAMQFRGEKPKTDGDGVWKLYGIAHLNDLRYAEDRDAI